MGKKSRSKLGHLILEDGFSLLINSMVVRFSVILRQLANNRNEEIRFGRFINNPKVTPTKLVDHNCSLSPIDVTDKNILVISDTSTIVFEPKYKRKNLGYIGANTEKAGFYTHPAILLDADNGACYGLAGISAFKIEKVKTDEEKQLKEQKIKNRWHTLFEEKTSYKWFEAPEQAIRNCPGAASYTLIGDRESDIYELIARTIENKWDFVYRSQTDRRLSGDDKKKLSEVIEKWPVASKYNLKVPKTKNRSEHTASMNLKFGQVNIPRSRTPSCRRYSKQITLRIVQVEESSETVVGNEKPIKWILLTSHLIKSSEQAMQIVKWYTQRWTIEQVFRTLKKKGLNIENSPVTTYQGLINLATMALIAAVQVMQLIQARDGKTLQKLEDIFSKKECECLLVLNKKLEGNTTKLKNPYNPNSLAFGSWIIARLGGWSGYKKQRPPGSITIMRGLTRFYNLMEGYYLIC